MNCANHPERERVSFCQNCGKPLCTECSRAIGAGVFCEPCLAAKLAAAEATASGSSYSYAASSSYAAPSAPPAATVTPGTPNPALAALLGFIPGVGAMYNGQYAKGVVHLIIFTVLVSLKDASDAFGILVAGWVFYQVFEAYHTARARKDGTPLPNPFGLNDIGERFGFGKAWPLAAVPPVQPTSPITGFPPQAGPVFTQGTDGSQSFVGRDGTHFVQGADGTQSYGTTGTSVGGNWGAPSESYAPPVPPTPPFTETYATPYTDPPFPTRSRFPAGAIWLIALGLLFFFGSSGIFSRFPIHRLIPFLLIGLGIWIFIRKMTATGQTLADDGTTSGYRLRVFRALRGSVWIMLVGVLFFLDSFNILSWGHSWPLFIILAGLMTLFERSTYNPATSAPYGYPAAGPMSQPPAATSVSTTSIATVPVDSHGEEGR